MLSYKMDFSSCDIMPGFGKSSHIYINYNHHGDNEMMLQNIIEWLYLYVPWLEILTS